MSEKNNVSLNQFIKNYNNINLTDNVEDEFKNLKLTAWRMLVKNIVERFSSKPEITSKEYYDLARNVIEEITLNDKIKNYTIYKDIDMENLQSLKEDRW